MSDLFVTTRLLSPWDFPGKNTGVGCHFLLQRIFLTQGLRASPASLALQIDSLPSEPAGKPSKSAEVAHLDTSFEEIPYNLHPPSLMLEIPYNLDPPNLSWFGWSNFLILDSTVVFQKENHKLRDFYLNNVDSIRLLYYI